MRQAGPVGHLGGQIVEVGNMNLAIVSDNPSGQVGSPDRAHLQRQCRTDAFGTGAEAVGLRPFTVFGEKQRDAGSAEQPSAGFGDLPQRLICISGSAGNRAQDFGGRFLSRQCLLRLVEQPRVLDRDHGLVGEALLKRQLVVGERRKPVTVHDQRADRLSVTPQRRAADRADARGARGRRRPVRHRRIDIVEIGNVDLPVLSIDRARAGSRPPSVEV